MGRARWALIGLLAATAGACQAFGGLGDLHFTGKSSAGGGSANGGGGANGSGAGPSGSGGVAMTSSASTTGSSTVSSTSSSSTGGLDPNLSIPPSGAKCTNYGGECAGETVCRIATKNSGRCEGTTDPHELAGPCTTGEDCDILFECYMGQCTNFCMLGTTECGPPQNCINVGNDTEGVCWPVN